MEIAFEFLKRFPGAHDEDLLEDQSESEEVAREDRENEAEAPDAECLRDEDEGEDFYEVERIEAHRYKQGWRFLTVWKGYSLSDATWEPVRAFVHNDGSLTGAFKDYCETKGLDVPLRQAMDIARAGNQARLTFMTPFPEFL